MKEKGKEYYFEELLNYLTIKVDTQGFNGWTFYFKDNECYFQHNLTNGHFFVKKKVFDVFMNKYKMSYSDTSFYIRFMVEPYFKLKYINVFDAAPGTVMTMENHFK